MTDPKKFRSLEEVKRFLAEQTQELSLDDQTIDRNLGQLARLRARKVEAADIMDISGPSRGGRKVHRTMNVDFPVVKVPNAEQLKQHYELAERLSEKYKYIVNTENEVRMNFTGENNPAFAEVIGSFEKLKQRVETKLRELFAALSQVAEGHAPKEYKRFVSTLAQELEQNKHIECDGIKTMTYAALDKDNKLVFAGYIILQNAVSDEGKTIPQLYITIKWTVGGDVELFVENEFVAPTLLDNGITISDLRSAATAIAQQMSLEGFSSQIGNLPVSMQIKEPAGGLRREAFSARDYITKIDAETHELIFTLNTTDPQKVQEVQGQIYAELKGLLRKKRGTTIKVRHQGSQLSFSFSNLDHGDTIHPIDVEFLQDKYKLTLPQLRKITNIFNGG